MTNDGHDVEERLRADLDQLADLLLEHVDPATDPGRETGGSTSVHNRLRRWVVLGAAASVVAVVATGIVATVLSGDDEAGRVEAVGPSSTSVPPASIPDTSVVSRLPGVTVTPPAPLSAGERVAMAWTGSELVVWGGGVGGDALSDGAAYDPAAGTWRSMAASPLPEGPDTPVAAATSAGVVVIRGTSAAMWDPDSDTWQSLPDAPEPVTDLVGSGELAVSASAGAVLDLGVREWELLPAAPVNLKHSTTAWTGQELVVLGESGTASSDGAALVLDLEKRTWRETSPPPEWLMADVAATWDGDRVIVADYAMNAAGYDPVADTWESLPDIPARFSEWGTSARTSPAGPVVAMANTLVVLGRDGWIPLPTTTGGYWLGDSPTEAGSPLAIWQLTGDGQANHLLLVDIEVLLASGKRQVGAAMVTMPAGATQAAATGDDAARDGESVAVDLGVEGRSCTVTSSYLDVENVPSLAISEEIEGPRGAVQWTRDEGGTRWIVAGTASDLVEVICDDAIDARTLVEGIVL